MLSRWLDTLKNGLRLERMNFRMHRFSIIDRSTDTSAGTITSSSMHSMPSLTEYSLSFINYERVGVIPSSSSCLLAHFRLLFSREKVLRANVSLTSFCTMINIVRRYEIFFQRVSAPKRTRG